MQSTPSLTNFDPAVIPYQKQVIQDIRKNFDYSLGTHEVLLSGSVGSAKSTLLAHLVVTHCMQNAGAKFLIGRLSMPALKSTLLNKILEHLNGDLVQGVDYEVNITTATIRLANGSEIISRSWADKKYFKVRSLELSGAAIEESSENETDEFYTEIKMRVGRLPYIKENFIIHATNPSSPSHWLYKYFIEPNRGGSKHPTRWVYQSRTEDNPYLPSQYIDQLKRDLDPKMARRMLYGEWIEIRDEVIYYQYNSDRQYSKDNWRPRDETPIVISWDFNIGLGKPMSAVAMCYQDGCFHVFAEVVIDGARTEDAIQEFFDRNIITKGRTYEIDGDASGKNRSTNSKRSDYDIIREAFDRAGIAYSYKVRLSNPPIRQRHNLVNAYCMNDLGQVRLFIHNCPTADEGLRLTALKKGANIIENDDFRAQHITTAIGYCVVRKHQEVNKISQTSQIL